MRDLQPGEKLGPILERLPGEGPSRYKRTLLGMYVNHQGKSNADFDGQGKNWHLVVASPIKEGEEIVTNYGDYEALMEQEQAEVV